MSLIALSWYLPLSPLPFRSNYHSSTLFSFCTCLSLSLGLFMQWQSQVFVRPNVCISRQEFWFVYAYTGDYPWRNKHHASVFIILLTFLAPLITASWSIYVLYALNTFGSHPQCNNNVVYVMLFVTIRATSKASYIISVLWIVILVLVVIACFLGVAFSVVTLISGAAPHEIFFQSRDDRTLNSRDNFGRTWRVV